MHVSNGRSSRYKFNARIASSHLDNIGVFERSILVNREGHASRLSRAPVPISKELVCGTPPKYHRILQSSASRPDGSGV
jgi:hypothetical protein